MLAREHVVSMVIGGVEIGGWTDYEIASSLITPADTFSLGVPPGADSQRLWDTVRTDRPVKIAVDGIVRLTGFVDKRSFSAAEGLIKVSGRSVAGRLTHESAESVNFDGLTLKGLLEKLVQPWIPRVVFSNARNRRVVRGKGKRVASSDRVFVDSRVGKRIEPGQMRWAVIEDLCAQAGYICWVSADGQELVVGQPDYTQEVQYRFRNVAPGSGRSGNVVNLEVENDVTDRYSRIIALGAGAGTAANYGLPVAARAGEAKDNPDTADGTGRDFTQRKVLVLHDRSLKNRESAQRVARQEQQRRDLDAELLRVTASRHGQVIDGASYPTLYATDTLAFVEDEVTGTRGTYLVVGVTLSAGSRDAGEQSVLELLPAGTELIL